jgi:hypothetical protein
MANVNKPFGLSPHRSLTASPFNEAGSRYCIKSTDNNAYYVGDLVLSTNDADANGVTCVVKSTTGTDTYRGVIVGVEAANVGGVSLQGSALSLEVTNIPATKTRDYYVYVVDDPMVAFLCQYENSSATNGTAAKSNNNCSFTIAGGSPAAPSISVSGTVIANASINTTSSLTGKLLGLAQVPNNAFGVAAIYRVKLNAHEFLGLTAGV